MGGMTAIAMTSQKRPYGPRAPNRASEKSFTLRMPKALYNDVVRAAKQGGVTVVEWVRAAIRMRLAG